MSSNYLNTFDELWSMRPGTILYKGYGQRIEEFRIQAKQHNSGIREVSMKTGPSYKPVYIRVLPFDLRFIQKLWR